MVNKSIEVSITSYTFNESTSHLIKHVNKDTFKYSNESKVSDLLNKYAGKDRAVCTKHINTDPAREVNYLLRNGTVEWLVPADECTLQEYLDNYSEQNIELELPEGIGNAWVDAFKWIVDILSFLQGIDWANKKINELSSKQFAETLSSKSGKPIDICQFQDLVLSKTEWRLCDLMRILKWDDEDLAKCMLFFFGYEAKKEDYYEFNEALFEQHEEQLKKLEYETLMGDGINNFLHDNHL